MQHCRMKDEIRSKLKDSLTFSKGMKEIVPDQ
jgi:hypothetical protein